MANLLSPATQIAIKAALQNVVDTFFLETVTLNLRTTVPDKYGENPVTTVVTRQFEVLSDFSVGKSGRYENIDDSPMGQRDESSWHLYFWAQDIITSGVVVNPEADTVTIGAVDGIGGAEYEIRMFAPTALFSDLGFLLWDMELKVYGG
jgi:hypothetical protein